MPERKIAEPIFYKSYSIEQKKRLYEALGELYSDNKRELFEHLSQYRTRHIAVVLEDIYQSHNASAVLRSCDCFGVQDVHVVEKNNSFLQFQPGFYHKSCLHRLCFQHAEAYKHLRGHGYKIVATLPHENDTMISDLDLREPVALVFGTELTGLTKEAIEGADAYVKIPMYGFTESFNISVCAALCLFSTTERLRRGNDIEWQMSEEELLDLKIGWSIQAIRDGENVARNVAKTIME